MDFYTLACPRGENAPPCALDAWVENLPKVFPASLLKDTQWGFAAVEAVHLLGLGLLGGCVLLLNLRLLGAGLVDEKPADLERHLRPWLWLGVGAVLGTGVLIGMLNPEKLYTSPAFFAKMIAMFAALVFSFAVTNNVARNEGRLGPAALGSAGLAMLLWLWSMGVFGSAPGANPGAVHLIAAGYAILLMFAPRHVRIAAVAAAAGAVLVYAVVGYGIIGGPNTDYEAFMGAFDGENIVKWGFVQWIVAASAVALAGLTVWALLPAKEGDTSPLARVVALFSMLSWVTVAAAGRWIGLS